MPLPEARAVAPVEPAPTLLQDAVTLSKAAADVARSAAEVAEKSAHLLACLVALAKSPASSISAGTTEPQKKASDPKRSEAAKRAWITIRNKRAVQAAEIKPAS